MARQGFGWLGLGGPRIGGPRLYERPVVGGLGVLEGAPLQDEVGRR